MPLDSSYFGGKQWCSNLFDCDISSFVTNFRQHNLVNNAFIIKKLMAKVVGGIWTESKIEAFDLAPSACSYN